MADRQTTFHTDRADLERLLGPAQEFGSDALCWTPVRLPDGASDRAVGAYDPGRHEALYYHSDGASGLRVLVAIHSTALGPSLGGTRWYPYDSACEALIDVLRLSAAMTAKAALTGLDVGGGKAAVIGDAAAKTPAQLAAYGRFLERLEGRYITTMDVGTTMADLDAIAERTSHVVGTSPERGGSGDTSDLTARTVLSGMHAALLAAFGDESLAGRRVVVVGVGQVGGKVARGAADQGASVALTDVRSEAAAALAHELGCELLDLEGAYAEACDVLSPNALGGVLSPASIPELRCHIVCGAANNQLLRDPADAGLLAARGILYAPDYVVNAGGLIQVAIEHSGGGAERARAIADRVGDTMLELLRAAKSERVSTAEAALRHVNERLASARAA